MASRPACCRCHRGTWALMNLSVAWPISGAQPTAFSHGCAAATGFPSVWQILVRATFFQSHLIETKLNNKSWTSDTLVAAIRRLC